MQLRALASAALVGAAVLPDRAVEDGPVVCLFRRVTGSPCPSCGLTRSWQALGHGRVSDAFRFHPFGPLTMVLALWLVTDPGAERRLAGAGRRWGAYAATGWIAAWIVRLSRAR
jgi:Protein of unknown function (DUF2752)